MDVENAMASGVATAVRFALYKRLAGSLLLYACFLTVAHIFWVLGSLFLEPGGVTFYFLSRPQSILTIFELSAIGLFILHRWRSTFCSSVAAFVAPISIGLVVLAARILFVRDGQLFDSRAYGTPADWSNAKSAHLTNAYFKAYQGHLLWSGMMDWLFLMASCVLVFYGKYYVLATHRAAQHAAAKVFLMAKATTCCFCGSSVGTFFFVIMHAVAGAILSAVLCSRMGLNDRLVDPNSGQIVDVYDRMTAFLTPTVSFPQTDIKGLRYTTVSMEHARGETKPTRFLMQYWYWILFGMFNGLAAAVMHVLGDRNVLAPIATRPSGSGNGSRQGAATAILANFGRNLLGNAMRSGAAAVLSLLMFFAVTIGAHWSKRVAGDADTARWDEVGDLQMPSFDADADGRFDNFNAIAGRLLRSFFGMLRLAWGIHFVLDVAQLALDECVGYPIDLATELLPGGPESTKGYDAANNEVDTIAEDSEYGVRAAVTVLDHTASSQFEYLMKCYHGGIDGLTGKDHDEISRRKGQRRNRPSNTRSRSHIVRSVRRRRGARSGALVVLTPSLGPGDNSNTDSEDDSLGSDPDEDGAAQTPWRRELRQGALRFHSVALRCVYVLFLQHDCEFSILLLVARWFPYSFDNDLRLVF